MRGRGRRPATPKRKAERAIWRTTLSAPLSWMLTYVSVRSASRQGRFRVLHPNIALSEQGRFPCTSSEYCPQRMGAFAHFIEISPSLVRSVLEHDENSLGDGITNRMSVTSLDTTLTYSEWSRSPTRTHSVRLRERRKLFRRRNYAPLSQTCTVGEFSPTLASRGAPRDLASRTEN